MTHCIHMKKMNHGFTRIELAATMATVGLLVFTQLPGLARQGELASASTCQNNLGQLQRAWALYVEDNQGKLPSAGGLMPRDPSEWTGGGSLSFSSSRENVDPEVTVKKSLLWNYTERQATTWRCPSDPVTIRYRNENLPRVRSYSMNNYMDGKSLFPYQGWKNFRSLVDFNVLPPSQAWLFIDEHPQSIGDGSFTVDMAGYPDDPSQFKMYNTVASGHARSAGVAFVDGHTEIKRWQDVRTAKPFTLMQGQFPIWNMPGNMDILWLQERTTQKDN